VAIAAAERTGTAVKGRAVKGGAAMLAMARVAAAAKAVARAGLEEVVRAVSGRTPA